MRFSSSEDLRNVDNYLYLFELIQGLELFLHILSELMVIFQVFELQPVLEMSRPLLHLLHQVVSPPTFPPFHPNFIHFLNLLLSFYILEIQAREELVLGLDLLLFRLFGLVVEVDAIVI